MAFYPKATRKNIPPGKNDPPIKPRVVILHIAATNATSLYDYFNGPSGGVESHFYVLKDGTVEQYRDTTYQADANVMANDFAISIETQGLGAGEWTAAQLATIKALLLWLNLVHGIPLVVCPTWDGAGVGYHTLFEDQWDQRHATCPGPDRIRQFNNVLVPWMAAGTPQEDDPMADITLTNPATKATVSLATGLNSTWAYAFLNYGLLVELGRKVGVDVDEQALAASLLTGLSPVVKDAVAQAAAEGGTPDQIADAVVAKLGAALTKEP